MRTRRHLAAELLDGATELLDGFAEFAFGIDFLIHKTANDHQRHHGHEDDTEQALGHAEHDGTHEYRGNQHDQREAIPTRSLGTRGDGLLLNFELRHHTRRAVEFHQGAGRTGVGAAAQADHGNGGLPERHLVRGPQHGPGDLDPLHHEPVGGTGVHDFHCLANRDAGMPF